MLRLSQLARFLRLCIIVALGLATIPTAARAQLSIGISVNFGPPAIPQYEQPPCPTPNYIWSPGYWAYGGDGGYYWVPGTWVPAAAPGLLWTPGYWGYDDGAYRWNQGYWAPQVGFYGGVNYGYGYYGRGYAGGGWQGRQFRYNTAVTNVNRTIIRNVYVNRTVVVNHWNRQSYNGGNGGLTVRPTQQQLAIARGRRVFATSVQVTHQRFSAENRQNFSAVNRGRPATAAVVHPFTAANRAVGVQHVAPKAHVAPQARAVPQHVAPQAHAMPQHVAPQAHAVPQHVVPQAHAAPQHAPPQAHAMPQHVAPQAHAMPQHAAPQAHAAPQHAEPQQHGPPRDGHGGPPRSR